MKLILFKYICQLEKDKGCIELTWCFIKIDEKSHLDEWNVKQNHDWCPLMLSCLQCTGQSQTLKVRDNKVCVVKRWAVIKIDEKRSRICTYYISSNFLWYAWKFEKNPAIRTGHSFWDRLCNFLRKFAWIILSVHNLNKLCR